MPGHAIHTERREDGAGREAVLSDGEAFPWDEHMQAGAGTGAVSSRGNGSTNGGVCGMGGR